MAALVEIKIWGYRCLRCGHEWVPRGFVQPEAGKKPKEPKPEDRPRVCGSCKSPYWDRPRRSETKK